jgi:hypothetical protein
MVSWTRREGLQVTAHGDRRASGCQPPPYVCVGGMFNRVVEDARSSAR